MTREEKLKKAHQMFDNRNLLTELCWQREYFKRGYVSNKEELFNLWIFDECIKALEQEPVIDKIRAEIEKLRPNLRPEQMTDYDYAMVDVVNDIVAIIDKYKAESEE